MYKHPITRQLVQLNNLNLQDIPNGPGSPTEKTEIGSRTDSPQGWYRIPRDVDVHAPRVLTSPSSQHRMMPSAKRYTHVKHVMLLPFLCILFLGPSERAHAEDVQGEQPADTESTDVYGECNEDTGAQCESYGEEADGLPAPGTVPLDQLAESIEKGEEEFSGCTVGQGELPKMFWGVGFLLLGFMFRSRKEQEKGRL